MKFSAAVSLAIAPLVLAKSAQNVYPHRRSAAKPDVHIENKRAVILETGLRGFGVTDVTLADVVILWINPGLNAATTLVNQPVTVTRTVFAGAGAATAAPGVAAPPSNTVAGQPSQASGIAGPNGSIVPSTGVNHTVVVGGPANKLTFDPAELKAAVGDTVIFEFLSTNHSATQSAFATPCDPLAQGFDSGFQPNVNNTVDPPPRLAMQVMTTSPVWFYCRQTGHCGKGMTFSINPTAAKTQAMFQAMAIQQAGSGTGTTITGSSGAAPPPAADSSVANQGATSLTATLGSADTATAVAGGVVATSAASPGGIVTGTGTLNSDGSCSCAVVCQAGAFPAVAQGTGAFGGFAGAIPATMVGLTTS